MAIQSNCNNCDKTIDALKLTLRWLCPGCISKLEGPGPAATATERDRLGSTLSSRDRDIHAATAWMSEYTPIMARIEAIRALPDLLKALERVAAWDFDFMGDCVAEARVVACAAIVAAKGAHENNT